VVDLTNGLGAAAIDARVLRLAISVALGLFFGLEREWSQKPAGIRTFALVSVLGTVFTTYDRATCAAATEAAGADGAGASVLSGSCLPLLSLVGALFVVVLAAVLMVSGMRERERDDGDTSLNLTTSVSLLLAYGVGLLVGHDQLLPATVVAVTSSLLLALKRQLHELAWGLTQEELQSVIEFAILAFVVYPLLPAGTYAFGVGERVVRIEPRVVWLMVVFVAGIGIANYVIVQAYGGRGVAVTGFFGGLASSTAVVGTMLDQVAARREAADYAVAGVLLADAAMALRNLVIVGVFTVGYPGRPLLRVGVPLAVIVVGSGAVAVLAADWRAEVSVGLSSPFSLRNALEFGGIFFLVVVGSGLARATFGTLGFYVTAFVSGLVSSAGAATSAVVLYRTSELGAHETAVAVMLATGASILVKAGLAATSANRSFARRVVLASVGLLAVASAAVAFV